MPTLVIGELPVTLSSRARSHTAGFTLIELLVVIVILAITIALIAPNFLPDETALIRREGQTVGLKLQYAYSYAQSTGRPLAWMASGHGSKFQELDDAGSWQTLPDHPQLTQNTLPYDMVWNGVYRIIFIPGEAAPEFQIQLNLHRTVMNLRGDALGRVNLENANVELLR
jgi:general secretion pathway protein H